MFARFRSLFRALTSRRDFEAGMTEELRFHIEQYTEDLVRAGISLVAFSMASACMIHPP